MQFVENRASVKLMMTKNLKSGQMMSTTPANIIFSHILIESTRNFEAIFGDESTQLAP